MLSHWNLSHPEGGREGKKREERKEKGKRKRKREEKVMFVGKTELGRVR